MDESALKVLISNLERSRATLDSWLFAFTLFVVVGVVLEVVFVIWEYRDELHDWRRGIVHSPEKPSIALLVFGLFGAGLVAIGVTGELYIGAKIGAKETSIREANDHRASLLSKLAVDAAQSAKTAHDEADAVKVEAKEIDSNLARTQYLLSSRFVTNRTALVSGLKRYKGVTVRFSSYNSEPDESWLCGDLMFAAQAAEMKVMPDFCGRLSETGKTPTGVIVSGPDIQQTLALAQLILHTANLGPGGIVSGIKAPELTVLVGAKPPFVMGQARGVEIPKNNKASKRKAP
jgi:hypothetical protein